MIAPQLVSAFIVASTLSLVAAAPTISNCIHDATHRQCWSNGFDINTNYYQSWPWTGNVVSYDLTVSNVVASPDGYSKPMMLVNGQYPGPAIVADWGDIIQVTVNNALNDNGTSIHFHGIRQYRTVEMDGVNGVTECPLAPGESKTYTFHATQFGTSWYHSHFSVQLGEGVLGPIIINGPASGNYDVDVGHVMLTENYHQTAFSIFTYADTVGQPSAPNGLINGMNTNVLNCTKSEDVNCKGTGKRWSTTVTKGQKYRLRLINTSVDSMFKVQIDNHVMTVIQNDFVPIKPFNTTELLIASGQRYDIIINANQALGNYWLRVIAQNSCSKNQNPDNIRGIIRYAGQSAAGLDASPAFTASNYTDSCDDVGLTNLVPIVPISPINSVQYGNPTASPAPSIKKLPIGITLNNGIYKWTMNSTAIKVDWEHPTLLQTLEGNTSAQNYPVERNVIELKEANQWAYFVIYSPTGVQVQVAHPIHLHGHDFSILAQGNGTFDNTTPLNYHNPPRRDTAIVPAQGFLVIAFNTDNPGAWLMHCHFGWHVAMGFSVQILERATEIASWVGSKQGVSNYLSDTCAPWNNYIASKPSFVMEDSGL